MRSLPFIDLTRLSKTHHWVQRAPRQICRPDYLCNWPHAVSSAQGIKHYSPLASPAIDRQFVPASLDPYPLSRVNCCYRAISPHSTTVIWRFGTTLQAALQAPAGDMKHTRMFSCPDHSIQLLPVCPATQGPHRHRPQDWKNDCDLQIWQYWLLYVSC
jgi:hypothetical protein